MKYMKCYLAVLPSHRAKYLPLTLSVLGLPVLTQYSKCDTCLVVLCLLIVGKTYASHSDSQLIDIGYAFATDHHKNGSQPKSVPSHLLYIEIF